MSCYNTISAVCRCTPAVPGLSMFASMCVLWNICRNNTGMSGKVFFIDHFFFGFSQRWCGWGFHIHGIRGLWLLNSTCSLSADHRSTDLLYMHCNKIDKNNKLLFRLFWHAQRLFSSFWCTVLPLAYILTSLLCECLYFQPVLVIRCS